MGRAASFGLQVIAHHWGKPEQKVKAGGDGSGVGANISSNLNTWSEVDVIGED